MRRAPWPEPGGVTPTNPKRRKTTKIVLKKRAAHFMSASWLRTWPLLNVRRKELPRLMQPILSPKFKKKSCCLSKIGCFPSQPPPLVSEALHVQQTSPAGAAQTLHARLPRPWCDRHAAPARAAHGPERQRL